MQTTTISPPDAPLALIADLADDLAERASANTDIPTHGEGPVLAGVAQLLGALDRLTAAIVVVLANADQRRVIAEEGLATESWLRAVAHRTGADAAMLLAASERLADMPATLAAFLAGTLSWGTVRGIVSAVKALTGEQRQWVDTTLCGDAARLAPLDGDTVVAEANRLVNAVRPDLEQQRANRAAAGQRLMFQPGMDGTGTAFAAMDAETFAAVQQAIETLTHDADGRRVASNVEALHALARQRIARTGTPAGEGDDNPSDATTDTDPPPQPAASASVPCDDVTETDSADPGGAPSTARPEMLIVTDVSLLAGTTDDTSTADPSATDQHGPGSYGRIARGIAELLWRNNRPAPTLTPDAVRRLACDATLRPILAEGHKILGTAEPYARISTPLRAALVARDGGCRFPACHRPADVCDAHHVVHKVDNGPTVLENLALLCGGHHRAVHEGGWCARLQPDGSMTFTRRGVSLHSVPRTATRSRLDRPPPRGRRTRPRADVTASGPEGTARAAANGNCAAPARAPDDPPSRSVVADDAPHTALPF